MKIRRPLCLVCIVFLCLVYLFMKGQPPSPKWEVDSFSGRTLSLSGKITDKQLKNNVLSIYLTDVHIYQNAYAAGNGKEDFPQNVKGIVVKTSDYDKVEKYIRLGACLEARGIFTPFDKPMNEGEFDSRSYYMIRGYEGQLKRAKITGVSREYSHLSEGLRRFRDRAFETIGEYLGEEDSGLLSAMTLGDKAGLDTEIKELYQNAGISHVLALSGLHIASVGLALLKMLRKMGVRQSIAAALSGSLIVVYGIMTGLSTSTLRAMIMFALAIIAMIIKRTYDLLSAAALSAILIVLENPGYLFDSGFLLSFGAIVAIGCVFPIIDALVCDFAKRLRMSSGWSKTRGRRYCPTVGTRGRRLCPTVGTRGRRLCPAVGTRGRRLCPAEKSLANNDVIKYAEADKEESWVVKKTKETIVAVRQGICVSLSITIVTLPVTAYSFFQVSRYSILLNLVIIPLMGIVLATGFAGIGLGLLAEYFGSSVLGMGAAGAFKIAEIILFIYEYLSEKTTAFSSNLSLFGRPSTWQVVLYAALLLAALFIADSAISEGTRDDYKQSNVISGCMGTDVFSKRRQRRFAKRLLCVIVLLGVGISIMKFHPHEDLEIRNLYVGQGDSAVILGKNLPVIMIDGGSTDVKSVGKYKIIPALKSNGIATIDYCFLTHMDNDHVNGIIEILENKSCGVKIKNVVMSRDRGTEIMSYNQDRGTEIMSYSRDTGTEILSYSRDTGTEILSDFDGENDNYEKLLSAIKSSGAKLCLIDAGDILKLSDLKITCLSPSGSDDLDENDSSLVLAIKYVPSDFDMIFTGDISRKTEQKLIRRLENRKDLLDCDYLKVAHHGSKNSSSEEFLKLASPHISVISAGIDNSYGHPHKETLQRLESVDTGIYCTAEEGEVILKVDKDRNVIKTRGRR